MDSEPFSAIRFITLQFPLQLAVYAAKLLILYPLMLLALFLYKGKGRAELIISSMAVLILYSASAAFLADPTLNTISISNTIFGTRYLLPIMPLLLASYAPFIEAVLKRIDSRKAVAIAAVLLLALGVPVLQAQAALTERNLRISEAIYQNTAEGSVIIGNDINYLFLLEEIGERGYIDIKTPDAKANNSYIVYSMSFMNRDKGAEEMKRALSAYNATQIYSRSFQAGIWATKPSIEIFIYRVENRGY